MNKSSRNRTDHRLESVMVSMSGLNVVVVAVVLFGLARVQSMFSFGLES